MAEKYFTYCELNDIRTWEDTFIYTYVSNKRHTLNYDLYSNRSMKIGGQPFNMYI